MSATGTLIARFRARFGVDPTGVWGAPGRVNVIGEHTDYNGGPVLPIALPLLTRVAATPRSDGRLVLASLQRDGAPREVELAGLAPGAVDGWAAYPAGVAWALADAGLPVGSGATLLIDSEVPWGAGLSSSAALECATGLALTGLAGVEVEAQRMALLAQRAENVFVGMPCGVLDQTAAMRCAEGHALYLDTATLHAEQVPFDLAAAGLVLLVVDTRAPHKHSGGEYAARRAACERAAGVLGVRLLADLDRDRLSEALDRLGAAAGDSGDADLLRRRVRHVVTEIGRVRETVALLRAGRVREIGPLLTASHVSLRDDYQVSVPELDLAVDTALAAGAHGARMTGGGFGGSVIALVEAERAGQVSAAIAAAFAERGFAAPAPIESTPSPGARRLA